MLALVAVSSAHHRRSAHCRHSAAHLWASVMATAVPVLLPLVEGAHKKYCSAS